MSHQPFRVLAVDSDWAFLQAALDEFLSQNDSLISAPSASQAISYLENGSFDVVVIGSHLADGSGLDLLRTIRETGNSAAAVIFIADAQAIHTVIDAFRAGAFDCLVKPCTSKELEQSCRLAREAGPPLNRGCVSVLGERRNTAIEMIGVSPAIIRIRRLIERFGSSDKAVLIEGESGTGKELVARALLRASGRASGPFVTVNCAALPESLLESEFFGHEKGAFTGATATKVGLFEAADSGTLFVDEIGELAPTLQAKLLRVLEDGSFRRVGSVKEQKVDVRLIAATNRDLAADSATGRFREDLYYRINVMSLRLPPLRERSGDISLLADSFLGGGWSMEATARYAIEHYTWPGNVRQLKNTIERGKVLANGNVIRLCDLPATVASVAEIERKEPPSELDDIYVHSREHVLSVLAREGGNKSHAARALGIHRRTLYRMLERWRAIDERRPAKPIA